MIFINRKQRNLYINCMFTLIVVVNKHIMKIGLNLINYSFWLYFFFYDLLLYNIFKKSLSKKITILFIDENNHLLF